MEKYDISSLNEEQLLALKQTEGAVLVTAGAGSGKTRLLTHRVAYLIREMGVSPYNILAITFTNKAAGEMKSRISEMVDGADLIWISTFHSMCARILRRDIAALGGYTKDFTIYSDADTEKVIKEVLEERGINDDKFKKILAIHISNYKNGTLSLSEYERTHEGEEEIRKICSLICAYEDKLKKNNALDFDDLLRKTYQLFTRVPEVLEHYANRFRYLLVDEFQDTNTVQYDLVRMLSSVHGNIFVVGDEDQSIYSWRGANFQNIFNFQKNYSDVKVFKLERNYRSTSAILQVANNVIRNNMSRLDKKMWTDKPEGYKPVLYNAYDERDEALFVAKNIERLVCQGYEYKDIAVLMRLNALSRSFEEAFLSYNIPHRIYGGFKFYERVEIRNVIAYLRIFINPKDDVSLERIINFPKRSIGDVAISKIKNLAQDNSMLETILSPIILNESAIYKKLEGFISTYRELERKKTSLSISEFVCEVIKSFKLREAYNSKDEEDFNRILNIESFISSVNDFENLNPDASLSEFLESITLKSDTDEIGDNGAVTIATVHAVKGLEFKVVFVIGLEDGIFPISRAAKISEVEEERRLLYVALTRAEEILFMSHCTKRYLYHGSQYQAPSKFIRELGLLSLEQPKSAFSNNYSRQAGYGYKENFVPNDPWDNLGQASSTFFDHKAFMQKEEKPQISNVDVTIYKVGQKVEHRKFGVGRIDEISDDGLVADIIFEDYGKKSLMLELAKLEILEG